MSSVRDIHTTSTLRLETTDRHWYGRQVRPSSVIEMEVSDK